ncbi:hypothetical protein GCM10027610_023610 [Dactylosporangium cerinum]
MSKQRQRFTVVLAAMTFTLGLTAAPAVVSPAYADEDPGAVSVGTSTEGATVVQAYWTTERIADATPAPEPPDTGVTTQYTPTSDTAVADGSAAGTSSCRRSPGRPT